MLAQSRALVSDYSSVAFDYMVLDKPIAFTLDDFDEYNQNRGFNYQDVKNLLSGEYLYDYKDLLRFLYSIGRNEDKYIDERRRTNDLVNYYHDGNNCKRITEYIARIAEDEK
ncbi:hypothetical protein AGMMS49992_28390 [Clostridia bacterium]|nr:hypothetical protein AGMMS49992_28390 [Clostridia bacterium]